MEILLMNLNFIELLKILPLIAIYEQL